MTEGFAELADHLEQVQRTVTAGLRELGLLPDGAEFELEPMDLQANAQWMARPSEEFLAALADPIPLKPRVIPIRDNESR